MLFDTIKERLAEPPFSRSALLTTTAIIDKTSERWRLGCHEGGHGISNLNFGIPVERIWLETNMSTGAQRGWCKATACVEDDFVELVTVLCGEAADWVYLGREPDHSSADRRKVNQIATLRYRDEWSEAVRQAWEHACDFVRDHREKIEMVAERLYEVGELSGDQVLWIAEQTPWPWRGVRTPGYIKPPAAEDWEKRNELIRQIMREMEAARRPPSPAPKKGKPATAAIMRRKGYLKPARSALAAANSGGFDIDDPNSPYMRERIAQSMHFWIDMHARGEV
jgi:hypothetical protein